MHTTNYHQNIEKECFNCNYVTYLLILCVLTISVTLKYSKYRDLQILLYDQNGRTSSSQKINKTDFWSDIVGNVSQHKDLFSFNYMYRHDNGTVQYGEPMETYDQVLQHLGFPPDSFVKIPNNLNDTVIVTAASKNFVQRLLTFISITQHKIPGKRIVVYDLGLPTFASDMLKRMCGLEYREFPFYMYPPHVKYLHNYAFKPLIIAEVLRDYPSLFWFDTSVKLQHGNVNSLLVQLQDSEGDSDKIPIRCNVGIMVLQMGGSFITRHTHKGMLRYLPISQYRADTTKMVAAGALILFRTETVMKNIMLWWVMCSLNRACAQPTKKLYCKTKLPKTGYADCHRYDMSSLSVILANYFRYNTTIYIESTLDKDAETNLFQFNKDIFTNNSITYCS